LCRKIIYIHFLAGCPSFSYRAKKAKGATQAKSMSIAGPFPKEPLAAKNKGTPIEAPANICSI